MTKSETDPHGESALHLHGNEIQIAHSPDAGPVTAVKNALLQASLAQLKATGLYERYSALVAPGIPEQILNGLAMSWVPIELAVAHYSACESMMLATGQVSEVAAGVGEKLQGTSLVAAPKKARESTATSPAANSSGTTSTANLGTLYRVWARHYHGGSVQIVRLGPSQMLIQQRGFVITQFRYFRQGLLAVTRAQFEAIGLHVTSIKIDSYSPSRDELSIYIAWD